MLKKITLIALSIFTLLGAIVYFAKTQTNVVKLTNIVNAAQVCTSTAKQSVSSVPDLFDSGLNNDQTGNLPKFDPNLGTLQSVDFTIENVYSDWDIKIENKGNAKNNLVIGITNKLSVRRPDGTLLLGTATDVQSRNPHFTAYDGVTDFAGTSGYSELYLFPASPATITQTTNLTTATDLTLFSGPGGAPGTLGILFDPDTISTASGVANVVMQDPVNWHVTASVVYNYCYTINPATLGDFVWNDVNANGIQDSGETGIGGATVTLTDTAGLPVNDLSGVAVGAINTPASGAYLFGNLAAGNYVVTFTLPPGYSRSPKDVGSDTTDSDADLVTGKTGTITLVAGQNNVDADAGGFLQAKLGDFVWNDTNANGIQDAGELGLSGAVVSLTDTAGLPVNDLSGVAVANITTPASGFYQFTNLAAGSYKVKVVLPATYQFSPIDNGVDTTDSDTNVSTGITSTIVLTAGQNNADTDAGAFIPAQLGDFVWNDANANGVQDAGEVGLAGAVVSLTDTSNNPVTDASGVAVASITTPGSGAYQFTNLIPGNYIVKFVMPAGYSSSPKDAGGNDTLDSDADILTGKTATVSLTSGQTNSDTDAGAFQPATLGDFVWNDVNANGIQDAGETGLSGAVVSLTDTAGLPVNDASGVTVANITTTATGLYQFTNLLSGNYQVKVVLPATYKYSLKDIGVDTKDSDTDTVTGKTATVTLIAGQNNIDTDSGAYVPAKLGDFIWNDANANGIQDAGEVGISGAVVSLTDTVGLPVNDASGVAVANITTTATGLYQFTNLVPGNYIIKVVLPATYIFTKKDQGANDAVDSDADPLTGKTATVTLTSGQTNSDLDAGGLNPAKLGDFVWEDSNANGIQDAGEPGITGAVVTLTDTAGNPVVDALGVNVSPITTPASGAFQFVNLFPGNYKVNFVLPSGYSMTIKDVPPSDVKDSDADTVTGTTATVTLIVGQTNTDVDAGAYKKVNLGDYVWFDKNHDGIQDAGETGIDNVKVELRDSTNTVIATQTTTGGGKYQFTSIIPGVYTVKFTKPVGLSTSPKNIGVVTTDSDADLVTGITSIITLASGVDNQTIDAGYYGYQAEGDVWVDLNKDLAHAILPSCGTADPLTTECGVPTVTVDLKDATNTTIQTTTTDALGHYKFTNLIDGDYTIVETQPSAYITESPSTIAITIAGANLTGKDFAELPAQISGYVYVDANDDGMKDTGEIPVQTVTVKLTGTDVDGNVVSQSTTTDALGYYNFTNLRAGTFTLTETQPTTYFDGKDTTGNLGGVVTNDIISTIVLTPGSNNQNNNFGELYKGRISGCVYADYDVNDKYVNPPDQVIPAVGIELQNSSSIVLKSQTTDSIGCYDFTNIPDGTYQVKETQPTGYLNAKNFVNIPQTFDGNDDLISQIIITSNTDDNNNFSEFPSSGICGIVYHDKNKSNTQMPDANEEGFEAWTLTLTSTMLTTSRTTLTDSQGRYCFNLLIPGSYTVTETQNPNYQSTYNDDNVEVVALTSVPVTNVNFGEVKLGKILGVVWNDSDKSGTKDPLEKTGVPNATIEVRNSNDKLVNTVTTDNTGNYEVGNLFHGTYSVTVKLPDTWKATTTDILGVTVSEVDAKADYGAVKKLADTGSDYSLFMVGMMMILVGFGVKKIFEYVNYI